MRSITSGNRGEAATGRLCCVGEERRAFHRTVAGLLQSAFTRIHDSVDFCISRQSTALTTRKGGSPGFADTDFKSSHTGQCLRLATHVDRIQVARDLDGAAWY